MLFRPGTSRLNESRTRCDTPRQARGALSCAPARVTPLNTSDEKLTTLHLSVNNQQLWKAGACMYNDTFAHVHILRRGRTGVL